MANLETLQVTVDAKIDAYKKKMNEVKNVTKSSMQHVESELNKAKGPEVNISVDASLEQVSKAVESVKKKIEDIDKVKVGTSGFAGIGDAAEQTTAKMGKVQESLKTAKTAVKEIVKTHPVLAKLQSVLSAVVTAGKKGFGMLATAVDKTRGAIQKVSGVAQSLVQKFRSMVSPIKQAASAILHIGRNSETSAKKVGLLNGAVGKLVGLLSGIAIFNFAKSCIELGSDLQEVQNVVDTVFPDMKGQMNEWAQAAATQFGLSETMAKRYAGTFGAMARSFGFAEGNAYEMATTLAGLSGDIASFYNISQDEAYTKMKSVFTGETEALKELGVVMTQNALDQFALANGFGRTTAAMSEQEKVALRYAFVQDKLKNAANDFVRTQDGWANQVRMLNLQFQSLKATIGEGLINVFTPVIKVINILLSKIATVANAFKALTSLLFGKGGQASGGTIGDSTSDIAGGFDDAADSAGNLADATDKAGDAAADAAKKALGLMAFDKINKLADDAASSGGSGGGSGGGGAGGGGGITGDDVDFGELEEEGEGLGEKLAAIFDVFQQAWEEKGQRVIDAWSGAFENIKVLAGDIGNSIYEVFTNGTGLTFLENVLEVFADIGDIVAVIAETLDEAWNNGSKGTEFIQSLFDKWNAVLEVVDAIADSFVRVWGNGTGESIFSHALGIMTNMNEAAANLAQRFKEAWEEGGRGDSIIQHLLDIVDIVLEHVENITEMFKNWAAGVDFGPLLEAFDHLLDALGAIADVAGEKLEWLFENIIFPLATMTVEETLPDFIAHVADALNALADGDFSGAGKAIAEAINGIVDSIKEFADSVDLKQAIEDMANDIAEFINGFFEELDLGDVGKIVGDAIVAALNGINTFLEKVDWHQIGSDIGEFLANVDWLGILENVCELIVEGLLAVGRIAGGIVSGFVSGLADKLKEAVTGSEDFNLSEWLSEKWDDLKVTIKAVKDKTFDTIEETFDKIKDSEAVKTIKGKIGDAWDKIKDAWEKIKDGDALKTIKGKTADTFKKVKEKFEKLKGNSIVKTIKGKTADTFKKVKSKFNDLKSKTIYKTIAGKTASSFDKIKKKWNGIKGKTVKLKLKFAAAASGLATWMNNNIRSPLQSALSKIPIIGSSISLPYFANGAYLPANTPTLAMVGDNRNHAEYVAPEPKLQAMADRAAEKAGTKLDYAQLQRLIEAAVYAATVSASKHTGNNEVNVKIDGDPKKMFRVVVDQIWSYYRQHGTLPFPT